ncbi:MAG: hypothetical protein GY949_20120 [Gammaproteobacteria bacterium]|nr:hypothetical protein [Gammaproteobacteria bacterium]
MWVALKAPRRVRLSVWHGLQSDESGERLFTGPDPDFDSDGPPDDRLETVGTMRVGDHLHIAVVQAKTPSPLLPGRLYSYNLSFGDFESEVFEAADDLKSQVLLRDGVIKGAEHLALGYSQNFLPAFATCPTEITDLNVVHGSCRRINISKEDGLAWLDDLIHDNRADGLKRPHQLMMSGDQIYADDVALPMLPQLIERGRELLGPNEFLPMRNAPDTVVYHHADKAHLPAGMRHRLLDTESRFTTKDNHSHLISFGEYCAMYLFVWSNVLWDMGALQDFDDIVEEFAALPELPDNWLSIFKKREQDSDKVVPEAIMEPALRLLFSSEVDREERLKILKDEMRGDKDFRKNGGVLEGKPGDARGFDMQTLSSEKLANLPDAERERFAEIYEHADTLDEDGLKQFCILLSNLSEAYGGLFKKVFSEDVRKRQIERFHATLPKVRRALANVSTYMIFDDHEVTDDWNLNPMWRDRVLTTPLGRTIIRNGLVSYALFQGWGNDPDLFSEPDYSELLTKAGDIAPAGEPQSPPAEDADSLKRLDQLLGLNGGDPPIKWHFSVDGARHRVIALDNRTRRSFVTRVGPPGNVGLEAMKEQVPLGPLPAGLEVLIVIAPLPVIGPSLFDDLIAPLAYRAFDLFAQTDIEGMPGTNPDAIEAWVFDPNAFEALLKRLETYRRVVLLSGDVHYGASQQMSYWNKDDEEPARFAQFTSSGFRNVMPSYIQTLNQSFAILQRMARAPIDAERLAWDQDVPDTLIVPQGGNVPPTLRPKLAFSPVLIPTHGWPDGTDIARPTDWRWRMKVVVDERAEEERPEPSRLVPLSGELGPDFDAGYGEIAARHASQLEKANHTRQIIFNNNLGVVSFAGEGRTLTAIHELYSVDLEAADPRLPEVYARHEVPLNAPAEQPPKLPGET